ncbi:MAG: SDR family oxidoreductase [Flavobacteriales bacterium]|nr:SDR family oxidoreductase [Flavobacteriales bacterium]
MKKPNLQKKNGSERILLTGATGYIGQRLLLSLIKEGFQVICCVRDRNRFSPPPSIREQIEVLEMDFLDKASLSVIPKDIDGAYYLMHSMSSSVDYKELELRSAKNFKEAVNETKCQHTVYLSGIINEDNLSDHLDSRKAVENELSKGKFHLTTLRAGIIVGSGSASFEIMRDLVEKLPLMITPKWLQTLCQPIGIRDVISFLTKTLFVEATYDKNFDIGGPDILSYKDMLLGYAEARGLKRVIYTVPVMTPKLSSYWLYFVTSTSYKLARSLVASMHVEVVCRNNDLNRILEIEPIRYKEALSRTLQKVDENEVVSSWKDSLVSGRFKMNLSEFLRVPRYGCFVDQRRSSVKDRENVIQRIWSIGGENGWYYGNWLWRIRGFLDKLWGGVGLRRGRTNRSELKAGDSLDFWRVLYANKEEGRLLLFAEMRLPGEAWLEFDLKEGNLQQTATFRPKGLLGRIYWYSVLPFHGLVFNGMLKALTRA